MFVLADHLRQQLVRVYSLEKGRDLATVRCIALPSFRVDVNVCLFVLAEEVGSFATFMVLLLLLLVLVLEELLIFSFFLQFVVIAVLALSEKVEELSVSIGHNQLLLKFLHHSLLRWLFEIGIVLVKFSHRLVLRLQVIMLPWEQFLVRFVHYCHHRLLLRLPCLTLPATILLEHCFHYRFLLLENIP